MAIREKVKVNIIHTAFSMTVTFTRFTVIAVDLVTFPVDFIVVKWLASFTLNIYINNHLNRITKMFLHLFFSTYLV